MLGKIVAQDGFAHPARTAVRQHDELLLAEAEFPELSSVQNFINGLQFDEMISASERAERVVKVGGLKFPLCEDCADIIAPGVFEIERELSPAVEFCVPANQIELEKSNAAADIRANEM